MAFVKSESTFLRASLLISKTILRRLLFQKITQNIAWQADNILKTYLLRDNLFCNVYKKICFQNIILNSLYVTVLRKTACMYNIK